MAFVAASVVVAPANLAASAARAVAAVAAT
jgi:hypothetical protein